VQGPPTPLIQGRKDLSFFETEGLLTQGSRPGWTFCESVGAALCFSERHTARGFGGETTWQHLRGSEQDMLCGFRDQMAATLRNYVGYDYAGLPPVVHVDSRRVIFTLLAAP